MNARIWLNCLLMLALLGCQTLRPVVPSVGPNAQANAQQADPTVRGRVDFSGVRRTQSTAADVINSSTISFIDTGSNVTAATGKTDASGSFSLNLGTFSPVYGGTYILEAVKGLNNQAAGADAARFRTIVQWNGTGWLSCTNSAITGSIVINALTTALAIESALDSANVTPANTIGKVSASSGPAVLQAGTSYNNHSSAEIIQLGADLLTYLGADMDPLAAVPSILPRISTFSPTNGALNTLVGIQGAGFSPVPSGNTVTFNGVKAQVVLATATSLVVVVPAGASTGAIAVQTGRGSALGSSFSVTAALGCIAVSGFNPASGRAGIAMTLTGQFSATGATPSVSFAGTGGRVAAAVSAWNAGSVSVTVPVGAVAGTITVQQGMVSASSQAPFDAWTGEISQMTNISPATNISVNPYTAPYQFCGFGAATYGTPPRFAYMCGGAHDNGVYSTQELRSHG